MEVARTVLAGGKGGDNFKPLPICHEEGIDINEAFDSKGDIKR
ncbi:MULTISPECIES: hypothetical protein [unclassified Bacillus (in: firmicutes)]|nr:MULTISPECIES: hypothetical protein [unclassified Bacillus (in: firmicutes)]